MMKRNRILSVLLAVVGFALIVVARLYLNSYLDGKCDLTGMMYYALTGTTVVAFAFVVNGKEIKTRYKYINFEKIADKPKTTIWACRNNSGTAVIGHVMYYPQWRQYCFLPAYETVFSAGCLVDIQDFIGQLKG